MKTDKQLKQTPSVPAMFAGRKTNASCGRNLIRAWLMAAFLAAGPSLASAAIINVPADQPTIGSALAVANTGDEILIQSGTYEETGILSISTQLTLRATNGPVTVHVPSSEIAVAAVNSAVSGVVFDGIKFERLSADADWMQSAQLNWGSSSTFTNCTFTGPANGSGVDLFYGASAEFDSCSFSNYNPVTTWSAAILLEGHDATSPFSQLVVRNCTFDTGCNGWIKTIDFGNSPRVGDMTVTGCTFKAARYGQALSFHGFNDVLNYDSGKALLFQDCTFEGTVYEEAEFYYTTGTAPTSLKFSRCNFKAYNSTRKMFWFDLPAPLVFEDCLFAGGQHETIMTIWGGPPSVNLYNCTMINDGITSATSASGTSQSSFINGWDGGRTFNIVNCRFRCTNNYSAGFVGDAGSSANRNYAISHSVIDHPTPVGAYAQITPGAGYTNTSLASAFVNPASRDYHLVNGSPWVNGGIDLGFLLYPFDADKNARNQGSAPDMGAFELAGDIPTAPTVVAYEGFNYATGDLNGKGASTAPGDFVALGFGAWSTFGEGFNVDGSSGSPAGTAFTYTGNLANPVGSGLGSNRGGKESVSFSMASSTLAQTYGTSNGTVTLTFDMEYGYGTGFAGLELSSAGANTMFIGDGGGGTFIISGFGGAAQDTGAYAKSGDRFIQCVFAFTSTNSTATYSIFDHNGVQQGATVTRDVTGFSFNTVRLYLGSRAEGFDEIAINALYNVAPVTPTVSVARSAGNIIVTFAGVLQSAGQVQGPFTDVSGATSPLTVAPTGTNLFWRSRSP